MAMMRKASLNSIIPSRTDKEYYETNKEIILEYRKDWRQNNKDYIIEWKKEYYMNNKEYLNNKCKERYENVKEKRKEKITCECGCEVCKDCLNRHMKSKKHIDLMSKCLN